MTSFAVRFLSHFEHWGHTVYRIEVSLPTGKCWIVNKRYSEVRELHDVLRLWFGNRLPPMPGRKVFGNHDPAFLSERQLALQQYLSGALKLVNQEPALQMFIARFLEFEDEHLSADQVRALATPLRGRDRGCQESAHTPAAPAERTQSWAPSTCHQIDLKAVRHEADHHLVLRISRSITPDRSQSFCAIQEMPTEGQRRRRWSRRHRASEKDAAATSFTESLAAGGTPIVIEADAEETHEHCSTSSRQKATRQFGSLAASGRQEMPSLPESSFWEWPLSRTEKKLRVELIDSNMWALENTELQKENQMLRRRRKTSAA